MPVSTTNFIPEIWTARLLSSLKKNTVAAALVNRDYEGEIKVKGDTVNITSISPPTIGDYSAHVDISVEALTDANRKLIIDQSKYFAFEVDDIERAQVVSEGALLAEATDQAGYGLRDVADRFLFETMANGASTAAPDNVIEEMTPANPGEAYELLVDISVLLDQSNVPSDGRWVVVSPSFHGLLLKDSRFVSAGDDAGAVVRRNGRVGEAAGLQVHKSNNLPDGATTGTVQIAGYRGATSYAEQIAQMEGLRMEKRFADMVRGLHLYGAKVVRPEGLVTADVIVA